MKSHRDIFVTEWKVTVIIRWCPKIRNMTSCFVLAYRSYSLREIHVYIQTVVEFLQKELFSSIVRNPEFGLHRDSLQLVPDESANQIDVFSPHIAHTCDRRGTGSTEVRCTPFSEKLLVVKFKDPIKLKSKPGTR